MTRALVLDPGGVTGWSLWSWHDLSRDPAVRIDYGVIEKGLVGFKKWWKAGAPAHRLVICERFELDSRTNKPDTTPLLIEGALYMVSRARIVWQKTDMKAMCKDDVLKRSGLWLTGKSVGWADGRDVNDTARHALAYLKTRHTATAEHFWPPFED